jgi:hypothetical protein
MTTKTKTSYYDSSGLEALTPRAPWSKKNKHLLSSSPFKIKERISL